MPTGFKITTLRALSLAALDRRAVVAPTTAMLRKPLPAAFVISMQARIVADLLECGLYLYEKGAEMTGFGMVPIKREGYTTNLETGESHPTTDAERATAALDTSTYMEIRIDPKKQSREDIHREVDRWLDDYEQDYGGL